MLFIPIRLLGAYLIEPDPIPDDRGFFARTYCHDEFTLKGLNYSFVQSSISYNNFAGTLRGMHYQKEPYPEAKLIRCTQGAIYDVIIDLRKDSNTFTHWFGTELTAENRKAIYVPEGFAHGFLTLKDKTEVLYQMSEFFHPECSSGVRWNDSFFDIYWPREIVVISGRDESYKDFKGLID